MHSDDVMCQYFEKGSRGDINVLHKYAKPNNKYQVLKRKEKQLHILGYW